MTLEELKTRLGITNDSQDAILSVQLEDVIDYVKEYCNNDFKDGFPSGVKRAIALLVRSLSEDSSVQSQRLGDMSKTFFEGATQKEAHKYLKAYRKVKFI